MNLNEIFSKSWYEFVQTAIHIFDKKAKYVDNNNNNNPHN